LTITLSVHPAAKKYLNFFRAGEGECLNGLLLCISLTENPDHSKVVKYPPFPSQVAEFWAGNVYTKGRKERRRVVGNHLSTVP